MQKGNGLCSYPRENLVSGVHPGIPCAQSCNYNLNGQGSLSALDCKTGTALWTLELPGSVWASPVVAGDTVYVACADGKLYAVK